MFKTEQEAFWAGAFGDAYSERNVGYRRVAANTVLFERALTQTRGIRSICELGCNIGLNLQALREIGGFRLTGYEINPIAVRQARAEGFDIHEATILDPLADGPFDLTFTKGVLIHIDPASLSTVYRNLVNLSSRYVMIAEYYNPKPVEVTYRGHNGKLFKRDFAGELIDGYGLRLVDYGFVYHRDRNPQDDLTWFLMERT